jgi:hypothetical protein
VKIVRIKIKTNGKTETVSFHENHFSSLKEKDIKSFVLKKYPNSQVLSIKIKDV